jgi:hypothetical protein
MPQGSQHWKALQCAVCGAHLRFLPWPDNLNQRKTNLRKLVWLYKSDCHLPIEQQMWVDEAVLARAGRLSLPQQARFDKICAKYGADSNGAGFKLKGGAQ